jgi:outer membrane protein insertion porin family
VVDSKNPYKNPEYHKWRFNAEWYVPLGKPGGADKNRQFVLKIAAKYGFMGRYNNQLDFSPFERFHLGDAGLTNNYGLLGYDIIAQRGYPVYYSSDPTINPDQSQHQHFLYHIQQVSIGTSVPRYNQPRKYDLWTCIFRSSQWMV